MSTPCPPPQDNTPTPTQASPTASVASPSTDNSAVADANISPVATDNVDPAQNHIAPAAPLAAPVTLTEVLHDVHFFLDRKSWFDFLQDDGKSLTSEDEAIYLPNSANDGKAKKKTRTIQSLRWNSNGLTRCCLLDLESLWSHQLCFVNILHS